jgi:hypothetical protein
MSAFEKAWTLLKNVNYDVDNLQNLTPHPLNFYLQGQTVADNNPDFTVAPEANPLRVGTAPPLPSPGNVRVQGNQIPVSAPRIMTDIKEELPILDDSGYVVSFPAAQRHAEQFGAREDIFTVANPLRNEQGQISGASGLTQPFGIPEFRPRKVGSQINPRRIG